MGLFDNIKEWIEEQGKKFKPGGGGGTWNPFGPGGWNPFKPGGDGGIFNPGGFDDLFEKIFNNEFFGEVGQFFTDIPKEAGRFIDVSKQFLETEVPELFHETEEVLHQLPGVIKTSEELLVSLVKLSNDLFVLLPDLLTHVAKLLNLSVKGVEGIIDYFSENPFMWWLFIAFLLMGWFVKDNSLISGLLN